MAGEDTSGVPACDWEGCEQGGSVECVFPDDTLDGFYCTEHASKAGFCWACGLFWAGIESFDFDPHKLCDNCRDNPDIAGEFEGQDAYGWDWEDDYAEIGV